MAGVFKVVVHAGYLIVFVWQIEAADSKSDGRTFNLSMWNPNPNLDNLESCITKIQSQGGSFKRVVEFN